MAKIAREMVEKAGHGRGHGPLLTFALCRPYRALHEKFQIPGAYLAISWRPFGAPEVLLTLPCSQQQGSTQFWV